MVKYKCPNLGKGTESAEQFNKLVEAFGEPLAYYIWHNATEGNIRLEKKETPVQPKPSTGIPQRSSRLKKKDADMDLPSDVQDLPSIPDYESMSITSFTLGNIQQENEIVNTLTSLVLEELDSLREQEQSISIDRMLDNVLNDLHVDWDFFNTYTEGEIPQEAIEEGAYSSNELNKKRADNIEKIINNFYTIKEDSGKIKYIGYRERIVAKINTLNYNVMDEFESDDVEVEKTSFEDNWALKVDPETSMSAQVKRMLSFIPKRLANGKKQASAIGSVVYEDYNKVYSLIMNELVDTPIDNLHETLRGISNRSQIAKDVVAFLDEMQLTDEKNYNKFHTVFRRQQANFITVLATPLTTSLEKGGTRSFMAIDTNRTGAGDVVMDTWYENFKVEGLDSGLVVMDETSGQLSISKEKGAELNKAFNSIRNKEFESQIKELVPLLNQIGIGVTEEDLKELNKNRTNSLSSPKTNRYNRYYKNHATFNDFVISELGYIFDALVGKSNDSVEEGETWQLNNPFYTQSNRIKGLTPYYLDRNPDITSNSFKNGNGDTIQGNVMPHHASNRIEKINSDPAYVAILKNIPFIKNSTWLNGGTKMKYFDSAKMKDSRSESKGYAEQTPTEKEYTKIALFQKNGSRAITIGNTPSDKTTFKTFEFERHKVNFGNNTDVFDNAKINKEFIDLESPTMKLLYNVLVQSELNRIASVRKAFNEKINSVEGKKELIPGYHYLVDKDKNTVIGSGGYFFFVPKLNSKLSDIINSEGQLVEGVDGNRELKELLRDHIVSLIRDKVVAWNERGIIDFSNGLYDFNKSYVKTISEKTSKHYKAQNIIYTAAAELVVNYSLAYANEFMLVTGDPALFTKPSLKFDGWEKLIVSTADNIFKRTAKDIAPGIEGKFESTTFNTIFITEPKHNAEISKYKDIIGNLADGYKNLDIADAQEWTTLEEHLATLLAFGKIDKRTKDTLSEKAKNRLTASPENKQLYNFTWAELGTVLQPIKPVYVASKVSDDNETDVHYYIKTSSFPLIPQLTEAFEIDKLRVAMESNNIDRAVVNSGVKVGYYNPVGIFKDGSVNIPSDVASYKKTLTRDGFRIQQEVPYDQYKNAILEGSQLRKLKFSNLTPDMEFEFNGKSHKGFELKSIDDAIHNRLYKMKYQDLLKELGVKDNNTIEDVNNLKKLLVQSATDLGYGINDILLLNTIKLESGSIVFDIPLFFHNESDRIESMLNSIIKNRVLKNKMRGKSYVQGSSVGFTMKSENFLKTIQDIKGAKIAFVKDKDGNPLYKGSLEYRTYEENGKQVIYGEVFAPFNFIGEDAQGKEKLLLLQDYVDKDGFIDPAKLDENMLNSLGYRIPTQGHSSMIKLKIVGFLPQEAGDLVIVPAAITKQMGADFDVDKLYTHFYNYNVGKDGKISKVSYSGKNIEDMTEEELQNASMDITYSILSNQKVQEKYQFAYTDDPTLGNDKETINELKSKSKGSDFRIKPSKSSLIYDEYQSHMVDVNAAGKIGIGSYSSASANHVLFQYAGVYLKLPVNSKGEVMEDKIVTVMFSDENGNVYTDQTSGEDFTNNRVNDVKKISYENAPTTGAWRLDKVYTFTGRLISDVIKSYQSASVDNAKDQNLFDLHQNKGTFNVTSLIARAGFDEYFIDRFVTQPIIVNYVKRLNDLDKYTEKGFEPNKKQKLQEEMFKELGFDLETWKYGITPVSLKQMEDALSDNGADKLFQAKILYNFIKYDIAAAEVSRVQTSANTDTAFLGKSLYESIVKLNRISEEKTNLGNTDNLFRGTTQGGAVQYGLMASVDLFANNNLFPVKSKVINNIFEAIATELGKDINEDTAYKISSDIRAALFTQAVAAVFGKEIHQIRKELLYGTKEIPSLAKELKQIQATTKNPFLKTLTVRTANKSEEPDVIEFFSSKELKENLTMDMILGWNELLSSPEDSVEYKLGEKLVIYSLVIGNQRNARDFGRFIPYDYVSKKLAEYYRNIDFQNGNEQTELLSQNFITQWFQHNPYKVRSIDSKFISAAVDSKGKKVSGKTVPDGLVLKTISEDPAIQNYFITTKDGELSYPSVISYTLENDNKVNLYKRVGNTNTYIKIPALGYNEKLIKEYNLTTSNARSIFRENPTVVEKPAVNVKQTPIPTKDNTLFNSYDFNKGHKAVLNKLIEKTDNNLHRAIATFLLSKIDNVDYSLERFDIEKHKNSSDTENYEPYGRTKHEEKIIAISEKHNTTSYLFEKTYLHELIHAFTSESLKDPKNFKVIDDLRIAVSKHKKTLFSDIKWLKSIGVEKLKDDGYYYKDHALNSSVEFVAFLMSEPDFQKILRNIPYTKDKSVWDKIVEFVTTLLGINIGDNILTEGINEVLNIINGSVPVEEKTPVKTEPVPTSTGNTFSYKGKIIDTEFKLGEDQVKVLEQLIDFVQNGNSDHAVKNIVTLQGSAGTGKTSIIGYLFKYLNQGRKSVSQVYIAPTHAAVAELAFATVKTGDSQLPATLQSSLATDPNTKTSVFARKIKDRISVRPVIVVDESSMIDTNDIKRLMEAAERENAKIIFLGDSKQIPKPGASSAQSGGLDLSALFGGQSTTDTDTKPVSPAFSMFKQLSLNKVFRQSEGPLLKLLNATRQLINFSPLKVKNSESIKFVNSKSEFTEELYDSLEKDPEGTLVITYTNNGVKSYNKMVREEFFGRKGEPVKGDIVIGYLGYANKQIEKRDIANSISYTIKEVKDSKEVDGGKVIIATSKKLKDLNDKGVDVSETASTTYYQLRNDDALLFTLSPEQLENNNKRVAAIFRKIHSLNEDLNSKKINYNRYLADLRETTEDLAKISLGGDYIYNPKTNRMESFSKTNPNPDHKYLKKDGQGSLVFERGIDYGHAITIHKSQGTTINNVFLDAQSINAAPNTRVMNNGTQVTTEKQALYYVGLSRTKSKLVVLEGNLPMKTVEDNDLPSDSNRVYPEKPAGRSFKVAVINNKYIAEIGTSQNKRDIVNKYFRYRGNKDFNTYGLPYYEYSTGSATKDIALVHEINSQYTGRVVGYFSKENKIKFLPDADNYSPKFGESNDMPLEDLFEESSVEKLITNVDKVIITKEKQIKVLKGKLTERGSDKVELKKAISQLEVEVKFLQDKKNDDALETVLTSNVKAVAKTLEEIDEKIASQPDLDSLYGIIKNLSEVDIYIEGMRNIDELFSYTGEEAKNRIYILQGKINEQRIKYLNQVQQVVTAIANKTGSSRFETMTKEELFAASEDINYFVSQGMNMANSKSMLTRYLHQVIQLAKNKVIEKQRDVSTSVIAWRQKLEKHTGLSGAKLFDIFKQKYADGSWTGNFVSAYKQEYFDKKSELRNGTFKGTVNKKDYYKWLRENSHNISKEELKSGTSSVFSAEEMALQAEKLAKYHEDLAARKEVLENIYVKTNGEIDQEKVDSELLRWENKYSPYIYADVVAGKLEGEFLLNKGYKYTIPEKPKDSWKDKNFDRIAKDPVLKEFYDFMLKTFADNNKYLPFLTKLPSNYLPEITKTFAESMKSKALWEAFSGLPEELWQAISANVEGEIDYTVSIGNRKFKSVPTKMMLNKLSAKDKSDDIFKILIAHSAMANSYYHKSQVEPILTSGQQALEEMDQITTADTVKGEVTQKDGFGLEKKTKGNLVNTKAQLQHQVEVFLYENYRDIEGRMGKAKLSEEEKVKLKELDELLEAGKITKEQHSRRASTLGRQLTATGIGDVISKYTYLRALGLPNFMTPAVNLTFGLASNLTYAAGGVGVNLKDMRNAINMFMGAVINKSDLRKIAAFMEQLGILNEYNESLYGTSRTIVDNLAFYLQNNTEKMNRGTMMLAHLLHDKVKNKDGKEVSLYYAYKEVDGKLVWDTENFGEMQTPEKGKIGEHGVDMFKYKTYITRVNQKVHGDYDSALLAKRTIIGRAFSMFKTWLPMAIADRFGKEDFDDELEQKVKGRYLVLWTAKDIEGNPIKTTEFLKILAKGAFSKNGWNDLSELDRVLVRRNLKEMQMIVQFMIAVAALTLVAGGLDDDDEKKFVLVSAINLLSKAQQDMSFLTNPSAMAQLANNMVPAYSSVQDVFKVVPVVWKTVSGDPTYQSGLLKDQNRLLMWGVQVTPFASPGLRMWKNGERIIESM